MARVVSLPSPRSHVPARARLSSYLHLALDLLPAALLIGLLRTWATELAPRQGWYFTAEALLLAYAYFALFRSVHVFAHGRNAEGDYDRARAQKAAHAFQLGLRVYVPKLMIALSVLLLGALALDVLTARTGAQFRPNTHLAMLMASVLIWARYGAAVGLTAAHWQPGREFGFARAREIAWRPRVAVSFALASAAFAAVALAAIAPVKAGVLAAPSRVDELIWSATLYTGLAMLALWLQCRWAANAVASAEATEARASQNDAPRLAA
jgi:uncharacterized membrane protein